MPRRLVSAKLIRVKTEALAKEEALKAKGGTFLLI